MPPVEPLRHVGTVPTNEADARAALEALKPGEALTYNEDSGRVEWFGGVAGFGLSCREGEEGDGPWEGIDIGKGIESTLGDLADDGCFDD